MALTRQRTRNSGCLWQGRGLPVQTPLGQKDRLLPPAPVGLCVVTGQNPLEIFFRTAGNAGFQQGRIFVHMLHCKGAVGTSDTNA